MEFDSATTGSKRGSKGCYFDGIFLLPSKLVLLPSLLSVTFESNGLNPLVSKEKRLLLPCYLLSIE